MISPLAGRPASPSNYVDVPRLITAYYTDTPDPSNTNQRVAFGTSGHRGSSLAGSFNEAHLYAISQAVCEYRAGQGIDGPLYLGIDTHALSVPACASILEVLAAHGVEVMLAAHDEYTPTPAVSLAILTYNLGRTRGLADGLIITPSHNPPESGGIKYNPPHGGPAGTDVTGWIEVRANTLLETRLKDLKKIPYSRALTASTTHRYDYLGAYVDALGEVIDMEVLRGGHVHLGIDALGGAGVHYWKAIAEHYRLDLDVISEEVDPTFRFMTLDWDGCIRMDPSSPYAMQRLIGQKDHYDIAAACDTDHDRHGIVTPEAGLLPPNHYLTVAIDYLLQHRPQWSEHVGVGKTVVSSQIIDRVCAQHGRTLYEVPVGFKWFVEGLADGSLGFVGEESAGATFLRCDGSVWTTDKDGIVAALLAAEMTAATGRDPGASYLALSHELGESYADRVEAPATPDQKKALAALSSEQVRSTHLAGDKVQNVFTQAPGNGAAIGGVKVATEHGWFVARPSGTENLYKIYAESFRGEDHLQNIVEEAQAIVNTALSDVRAG